METMVGGQTAAGGRSADTWDGSEPIHFLLDSQMTIAVSSQGSSDSPNEDYARSTGRQQTPNSDAMRSGNSGSKRKSTDESSEPNIRSKRYKERSRMRQTEVKELAQAAKELAASWRDDTKAMNAPSEEQTASMQKLDQLDLSEEEYFFWFKLLENSTWKRKWFIMHEREAIVKYYRREMDNRQAKSVPQSFGSAFSGSNQGFCQPNPAANTAYNQFYPPPNPAATNFCFRPRDPTRDGNFM